MPNPSELSPLASRIYVRALSSCQVSEFSSYETYYPSLEQACCRNGWIMGTGVPPATLALHMGTDAIPTGLDRVATVLQAQPLARNYFH